MTATARLRTSATVMLTLLAGCIGVVLAVRVRQGLGYKRVMVDGLDTSAFAAPEAGVR